MHASSTVLEFLNHWAEETPNKQAFGFINNKGECDTSISYQELLADSKEFSHTILSSIKQGDRVALILPTSPEFIIAFFGCLIARAIPVPLSQPTRQHGIKNIQHILDDAQPTLCITNKITHKSLEMTLSNVASQHRMETIVFNYSTDLKIKNSKTKGSETSNKETNSLTTYLLSSPEKTAFLQYTSGSTSAPKGVMVSHKNIVANHKMIREVFGHNNKTRQLNWMPLYHDMGLIGHVLHPICNGHTSFLMDPFVFVQRPRIWLESISHYKITSTGGPNFCYQHCVKRIKPTSIESLDLTSLKVAYNGAEPINPSVIEDFSTLCSPIGFNKNAFLPCYGLAEATLLVSGIRHNQSLRYFNADKSSLKKGSVQATKNKTEKKNCLEKNKVVFPSLGKSAKGIDIKIINPDILSACEYFTIGEVCITGENVTQGYWGNIQATKKTYITYDKKRYLRTGDLGFLNQDEDLFITGRLKDLIIIDGKNHYPQDIEFTTQTVDELLKENSCAVFTIEDHQNITSINKLIVIQELDRSYRNKADTTRLQTIKENIKSTISQQHSLAVNDVILIDCNTMPKTTSGKIKRHQAKYLYENHLLKEVNKN